LVPHAGKDVELRRLLPGDAIGRAGFLTGVSTGIKLRAISSVVVVRLKKDALTPILKDHPEIGKDMLNCLLDYQQRIAEIDREIPSSSTGHEGLMHRLWDGMRRMHGLFH
jgi:CRP-like cAMP-binding protein